MRSVAKPLIAALAIVASSAPAHADAFKPSKKDQVDLGQRAAKQVRSEEKLVSDRDVRVIKLREIAERLLIASAPAKPEPWKFSFNLIDRPKELNAFAFPGGPIYFYTGLFDKFTTEDQIAGVLAHEITHVQREHWAYAYADQQKRALGLAVLLTILDANKTLADVASIGNEVIYTTKYSRKHETESDDKGFAMMVKAGFNPQGMVDSFKVLKAGSKGGKVPEWISTHPDLDKRVKALEDRISKSSKTYPAQMPLPWKVQ